MRDHLDLLTRAMADSDTDVLMLGRSGNSRWVTGAESLSVSGTRPFAPGCVVVREPASVHLLSITDEGVPPDIATDARPVPDQLEPDEPHGCARRDPRRARRRAASVSTRSRR